MTDSMTIVRSHFGSAAAAAGDLAPLGPRVSADRGEPMTSGSVSYRSADGDREAGVWECTPGGWAIIDRPNTEFVVILSGRATITDADGVATDLAAGDSIVLPLGWSGRWDIHETVRKVYFVIG